MGKGSLCNLNNHCKSRFLVRITDIFKRSLFKGFAGCCGKPGKGKVHAFYYIRKRDIPLCVLCICLNLWSSWMRQASPPCKLIKRISKSYIQSLSKDPVPSSHIRNNLGIGSAYVKNNRILCKCSPDTYFNMGMKAPDGSTMWGKFVFREIKAPERMVFVNSFSDEAGGVTRHPLHMSWPLTLLTTFTFDEQPGGKTKFTTRWQTLDATAEEQKTFDSNHDSMQKGWTGTIDQLAAYLAKQ